MHGWCSVAHGVPFFLFSWFYEQPGPQVRLWMSLIRTDLTWTKDANDVWPSSRCRVSWLTDVQSSVEHVRSRIAFDSRNKSPVCDSILFLLRSFFCVSSQRRGNFDNNKTSIEAWLRALSVADLQHIVATWWKVLWSHKMKQSEELRGRKVVYRNKSPVVYSV